MFVVVNAQRIFLKKLFRSKSKDEKWYNGETRGKLQRCKSEIRSRFLKDFEQDRAVNVELTS